MRRGEIWGLGKVDYVPNIKSIININNVWQIAVIKFIFPTGIDCDTAIALFDPVKNVVTIEVTCVDEMNQAGQQIRSEGMLNGRVSTFGESYSSVLQKRVNKQKGALKFFLKVKISKKSILFLFVPIPSILGPIRVTP